MSDEVRLWVAAKVGAAGAVGFAVVFATILLMRAYRESLPGLGYLLELLLFQLLVLAIGVGGAFPLTRLKAEWQHALLVVLGSHLLWLLAIYSVSLYVDIPQPNAMVLAVAGGFGVMVLLSERATVATPWLGALGVVVVAAGAVIWVAPLPGYLVSGAVWAVAPALGSLVPGARAME